jgi:hypothetical protein
MKLASLRCRSCGKERLVRQREHGATVACDACGATIDVPENLEFPAYSDLFADRVLAGNLETVLAASFVLCCLPVSAAAWWIAAGAVQRAHEDARPVDPRLQRVLGLSRAATVVQVVVWGGVVIARLR